MFWLRFLRLLASIAAEGLYGAGALLAFLFLGKRATWRLRITKLMSGGKLISGAGAAILGVTLLFAGTGCTNFPGASFGRQIDNTVHSARVLSDQSGGFDGFVHDLGVMFWDPEWDQLSGTIEQFGW